MRVIHVFTSLALISGLTALALLWSLFPWLGLVYAIAGYLMVMKEVSTYTSRYQFLVSIFTALLVGVLIDFPLHQFPFITIAMLLSVIGALVRIMFFEFVTLTGNKWLEPVFLFSALGFYVVGNFMNDYDFKAWVFPGVLIAFQGLLAWGVYKDQKQLGSHAERGYKVQLNTEAPDFTLPDQNGVPVSLKDYRGERHLLLIFVRGDWCPACHMMLRTYMKNTHRFAEKNIFCMAIGPDPVGVNREMVLKLGLEFKVLADERQRTAMQYGVQLDEYDNDFAEKYEEGIPLPASFLVDKNGIVRYVSRPDKVGEFLNPEKIFPILEKL
jgi:peroxiredoxin